MAKATPAKGPEVRRVTHIKDLQPDPENRRMHTKRNIAMLVDALGEVGAARSIVIDEGNVVLAGEGVLEAAAEAGITKVRVIDADGATIVAVRRTGLTPAAKRALAIYDNRAPEFATWDPDQLAADQAAGLALTPFFNEAELRRVIGTNKEPIVKEVHTSVVADRFWISVRGPLKAQAVALERLRGLMAELEGVVVELGTTPGVQEWGT